MEVLEQDKTLEGNILIAEFMGGGKAPERFIPDSCHERWECLMPAWAEFVKLYHELGSKGIYHPNRKLRSEFADAAAKVDINKCWEILTAGIQWHNSNPKKANQ